MNNQKQTNWGLLAILGTLGATIFGVWKSSKLGRILFITLSCLIFFGIGSWGVGKFSDIYYIKIRLRSVVSEQLKPITNDIELVKKDVADTTLRLGKLSAEMSERYEAGINIVIDEISSDIKQRYKDVNDKLDMAEESLDLILEDERTELKKKIIYLKEDVLVNGKRIESAEIRLQCESVVSGLKLLSKEERQRFYNDLKDIGFEVEGQQRETQRIYSGAMNGDIVYSATSCDSVMVYVPNRRYYNN